MNVLITGVRGVTGACLVEKLGHDHIVYGIDHTTEATEGVVRVFSWAEFSIIPDMDVVIHLAGKGAETIDFDQSLDYFEKNVGLTRCIFEWFQKTNAKQFYFLSSVKVIGNQKDGVELTEELEPKPFGPLGESKLLAEQYLQKKWLLDKKVYILRCALLHGKGHFCNDNTKTLFRWVRKGFPYIFGSFECKRSFTSLDNLSYVIGKMLEKDLPGGIYHITDDGTISAKDMYRIMGRVQRKRVRIWYLGKIVFRVMAKLGSWFHGYFDDYEYKKLNLNFVVSNRKIRQALGIQSMPVSLKDGLWISTQEYTEFLKINKQVNLP